jgi:hypothetical protein
MQIILALSLAIFLLVPALTSHNSWLAGWGNHIAMVIDHSKIDSPLSDFPVLVHLGKSSGQFSGDVSFIFDELNNDSDRKKIAITTADGQNQCYAEIEEWDSRNKEAWIWVRVPQISSNIDTILYLYYDRSSPDNTFFIGDTGSEVARNVWDDNFVMVQHLSENGQDNGGKFIDSTAHRNNGTGGGGNPTEIPAREESKIGYGQFFDGINDYIEVPDSDDLSINTTGHFTISIWISPAVLNFAGTDDFIRWMGKGDPGQVEYQFRMYNQNTEINDNGETRSNWISFYVFNPDGGLGAGGGGPVGHPLKPDEWIYLSASTDMLKSYMGFNGIMGTIADSWSDFKIHYKNGDDPLRIGTQYFEPADWWHGRLDEMRISNISRSKEWMKASFYSESDNLLDFKILRNQPPILNHIGDKTVNAGEQISFKLSAIDPDGDKLVFSGYNLPPGAEFDSSTNTFLWRPSSNQVGIYPDIRFQVSDGKLTDTEVITITVKQSVETPFTLIWHYIFVIAITIAVIVSVLLLVYTFLKRQHH